MSIECLIGEAHPDHKNDDVLFPMLNYEQLSSYAKKWVRRYSSVPIERVLLYNLDTALQQKYYSKITPPAFFNEKIEKHVANYAVIFLLNDNFNNDRNDKSAISDDNNAKEINLLRQPENLTTNVNNEFTVFMKHVEHSGTLVSHPFLDIDDRFTILVYTKPSQRGNNWRSEWDFYLLHKQHEEEEEPFYLDFQSRSEFWTLYPKRQDANSTRASGGPPDAGSVGDTETKPKAPASLPFKTPEGTTWRDIRLVIRNNEYTEVLEVNGPEGHQVYFRPEELGFRGRGGPGVKWTQLVAFARVNGVLSAPHDIKPIKPTVSSLRKTLKGLFPGIEGDPIPWIKAEGSWRTAFQVELIRYEEDVLPAGVRGVIFPSEVE